MDDKYRATHDFLLNLSNALVENYKLANMRRNVRQVYETVIKIKVKRRISQNVSLFDRGWQYSLNFIPQYFLS